ncbi:PapD-like protein [Kockovaella imperatae]|uniref:PapD-like protein n=1 Tax=Kockovaella imperatae TaxID=4999 RepID=A0A1Y1UBV8_9TREE|nr:PapD-like protein [Kockovaella imperatae]ORX34575.1 PapD-like protein [Kockovaella imperatae]
MSVELNPSSQLGFPRPLTQLVKRSMTIHNPNSSPIAFKVKTTAPKQYVVRPNSGRVEAGETLEVLVLLQPLSSEPPPHAKCKDKFLVQSAFISPDEEMKSLAEMWSETEKNNKSAIKEQKIKCAYLPAEDGSVPNGIPEENEEANGDQSRMMDESQVFAAPASPSHPHTDHVPSPATATSSESRSAPPSAVKADDPPSLTAEDIATSGASPTNVALEQSTATTSSPDDKLNVALREIDRLREKLAELEGPTVTGLRKRGGAAASNAVAGAEVAVEKVKEVAANSGVPIEIVGALVLAVFVLTYLFF